MAKVAGKYRRWREEDRGFMMEGEPGGAEPIATFDYNPGGDPNYNPANDRVVMEMEQRAQELSLATGVEHAVVLAADGKGYLTRGQAGSVGLAGGGFSGIRNAGFITHTHPPGTTKSRGGDFGGKGGSFSVQDIMVAQKANPRVMKAVGPEGTYIMSRPRGGWPQVPAYKIHGQIEANRARLAARPSYKGKDGLAFIDAVDLTWRSYARMTGAHYRFTPKPGWKLGKTPA